MPVNIKPIEPFVTRRNQVFGGSHDLPSAIRKNNPNPKVVWKKYHKEMGEVVGKDIRAKITITDFRPDPLRIPFESKRGDVEDSKKEDYTKFHTEISKKNLLDFGVHSETPLGILSTKSWKSSVYRASGWAGPFGLVTGIVNMAKGIKGFKKYVIDHKDREVEYGGKIVFEHPTNKNGKSEPVKKQVNLADPKAAEKVEEKLKEGYNVKKIERHVHRVQLTSDDRLGLGIQYSTLMVRGLAEAAGLGFVFAPIDLGKDIAHLASGPSPIQKARIHGPKREGFGWSDALRFVGLQAVSMTAISAPIWGPPVAVGYVAKKVLGKMSRTIGLSA